jgi:hypothetical protein
VLPRDEHLRGGGRLVGWLGVILSYLVLMPPAPTRTLSPEPKRFQTVPDGWRDALDPPEAPGGGRVSTRGTRGGRHRGTAEHLARAEPRGGAALDDERRDAVVDEGDRVPGVAHLRTKPRGWGVDAGPSHVACPPPPPSRPPY